MHKFNFDRVDIDSVEIFKNYFPSGNITEIEIKLNSIADKKMKAMKNDNNFFIKYKQKFIKLKKQKRKSKGKTYISSKTSSGKCIDFKEEGKKQKYQQLLENVKLARKNSKIRRSFKMSNTSLNDLSGLDFNGFEN